MIGSNTLIRVMGTNNPLICVARQGMWSTDMCLVKCVPIVY